MDHPEGLRIVHASHGRLRIHLPDPHGQRAAWIGCLPGVTGAEANELTGNILIRFDTQQTCVTVLLAELEALAAAVGSPPEEVEEGAFPSLVPIVRVRQLAVQPASPVVFVAGTRRRIYTLLGWSSVGMGVVGAILPGLPTVPFLVLASYFFIRSSPEARDWLLRSRWFGQMLRDWEERKAVKRSVKQTAVGLMVGGLAFTWLLGLPAVVIAAIVILEIIGLVVVLRLPEVEPALR